MPTFNRATRVTGVACLLAMQPALATVFEAENATSNNGAAISTSTLNSSVRYAKLAEAGDSLTFSVNAPAAGSYVIKLNEANGKGGWLCYVTITVTTATGATSTTNHSYSNTGGWESFSLNNAATVTLSQGINTITISGTYADPDGPNIDYMDIAGVTATTDGYSDSSSGSTGDSGSSTGTASSTTLPATSASSDATSAYGYPVSLWQKHRLTFDLSGYTGNVNAATLSVTALAPSNAYYLRANGDTNQQKRVTAAGVVELDVTDFVNANIGSSAAELELSTDLGSWNYLDKDVTASLQLQTTATTGGGSTGGTNTSGSTVSELAPLADQSKDGDTTGSAVAPYLSHWSYHTVKWDLSQVAANASGVYQLSIKPNVSPVTIYACRTADWDLDWQEGDGSIPSPTYINNGSDCDQVYDEKSISGTGAYQQVSLDVSSFISAAQAEGLDTASFTLITDQGYNTIATKDHTDTTLRPKLVLGGGSANNPVINAQSTTVGINFNYPNRDIYTRTTGKNGAIPFKKGVNFTTANFTDNQPWNPDWEAGLEHFSTFRPLNWIWANEDMKTDDPNAYRPQSTINPLWTERDQKTDDNQDQYWTPKRVAWEWQVQLANKHSKDLWVQLPHTIVNVYDETSPGSIVNEYAHKLAILIKYGVDMGSVSLKSKTGGNLAKLKDYTINNFLNMGGTQTGQPLAEGLKLYVEFSNEVWNSRFVVYRDAIAGAVEAQRKFGSNTAFYNESTDIDQNSGGTYFGKRHGLNVKYSAYAHAEVWRAFKDVFGSDPRLKLVLGHQLGDVAGAMHNLKKKYEILNSTYWNPAQLKPDYIAVAPYFGLKRSDLGNSYGIVSPRAKAEYENTNATAFESSKNVIWGSDPDIWEQLDRSISDQVSNTKNLIEQMQVEGYGARVALYEMGQHILYDCIPANAHPNMYQRYQTYLNGLGSLDIDVMMMYNYTSGFDDVSQESTLSGGGENWSDHCWGIRDNTLNDSGGPKYADDVQYKWKAVTDWINENVMQ